MTALCPCRKQRSADVLFGFEGVVLLLDDFSFAGEEFVEEFEEIGWVEGVDEVGRTGAVLRAGTLHDDDGGVGNAGANSGDDLLAGDVVNGGVEHHTVDGGKTLEGFQGFGAAVGGDDVELCGLDNQFAGRDAGGVFAVDDEKTGANHNSMVSALDVPVVIRCVGGVIAFWNV
jgi:hypothetical protein